MPQYPKRSESHPILRSYVISTVLFLEIVKKWINNEYPSSKEKLILIAHNFQINESNLIKCLILKLILIFIHRFPPKTMIDC